MRWKVSHQRLEIWLPYKNCECKAIKKEEKKHLLNKITRWLHSNQLSSIPVELSKLTNLLELFVLYFLNCLNWF